jgi:hypothetical protein
MNWFSQNRFLATLIGITVLLAGALAFLGIQGADRYQAAKDLYDEAAAEAASIERLPLYPTAENRDGKSKALEDYKKSAAALQEAFAPYRGGSLEPITPQQFADHLKAANDEVRAAFEKSRTSVPEAFFLGFENYRTSLADSDATAILNRQLDAMRRLMLALAASGAAELKNVHRPELIEENGGAYQAAANEVARALPVEISFVGREKAVREFLSAVAKPKDGLYFVIRSLRLSNTKSDPPRTGDVTFIAPETSPAPAQGTAEDIFGGGFNLPKSEAGQESKPAPESAAPTTGEDNRILAQVLGNEDLQVFLRLDLMQFLAPKELP